VSDQAIRVYGLKVFRKAVITANKEVSNSIWVAFNLAADLVVDDTKPRIQSRSGKAARSVKARSTQTAARIIGGSKQAPYYPWLDFGGRVGVNKSIDRPYRKRGRYMYKAYFDARDSGKFEELLEQGLRDVAAKAGLELD